MCGIVGILDVTGRREIDRARLDRMNGSQLHRGPDEGGVHLEPGIGLGHRRLSIIDLASGQQPLYTEDRSAVIVYNGEVYNFRELRTELDSLGHRFRTTSDTEVILRAWEAWGEACVSRLRGMFAFAIWSTRDETLFLARDRIGIKPLHYAYLPDGTFVFGSELKSLLAHPGLPREIDESAIEDYMAFGYVPEPKTILAHASKLAPGHHLSVRRGAPRREPIEYWDVPFATHGPMRAEDVHAEIVDRLREAVRIRLVSEVPLGAFLSGGIDSSAVVSLMAELVDEPIKTCSISFGDPEFNESAYAARVAGLFRTDHQVRQVEPDDYSLVDAIGHMYDEPFADSSAIPTYRVCELARERVTVALSGDGGDENFAGYRRYRWHMNEEMVRAVLPQSVRGPLFGTMGRIYPKADWAPKIFRAKATLEGCARDSLDGYLHSVSFSHGPLRRRLFSPEFRRRLDGYDAIEVFRRHAARAPTDDPLSLIQYLDYKTYLPGDILTKVDRASMAHSLEVRVPILDHEFVEWVSGLAPQTKLRFREGKRVFKSALRGRIPDEILDRPKMGFAVPISKWFRNELAGRVREALLGEHLRAQGVFDMRAVEWMLDQHTAGLRNFTAPIWSLLMLEGFYRSLERDFAAPVPN